MVAKEGPFAVISRRRWLKWVLTGGAVVTGGGVGWLALRGPVPSVAGLVTLSDSEYRTFASIAATQMPRGGAFEVGARDLGLTRQIDAFLAGQPPEAVRDLKRALFLFEYGPVWLGHHLATFSNLSPRERLVEWKRWVTSDRLLLRQVALAFRKTIGLFFYDQPSVWPHIGYPGPSLWGPPK